MSPCKSFVTAKNFYGSISVTVLISPLQFARTLSNTLIFLPFLANIIISQITFFDVITLVYFLVVCSNFPSKGQVIHVRSYESLIQFPLWLNWGCNFFYYRVPIILIQEQLQSILACLVMLDLFVNSQDWMPLKANVLQDITALGVLLAQHP